jgi:hypothetical protein
MSSLRTVVAYCPRGSQPYMRDGRPGRGTRQLRRIASRSLCPRSDALPLQTLCRAPRTPGPGKAQYSAPGPKRFLQNPSPCVDNREHARDTRGTSFRFNGSTLVSLNSMLHRSIDGTMLRIATLTEALYSAMLRGGPDAQTRAEQRHLILDHLARRAATGH